MGIKRGTSNLIESLEDDKSSTSEGLFPRKTASSRKKSKKEIPRKESDKNEADEEKKHEEVNADWIPEEALLSKQEMRECLFDIQDCSLSATRSRTSVRAVHQNARARSRLVCPRAQPNCRIALC